MFKSLLKAVFAMFCVVFWWIISISLFLFVSMIQVIPLILGLGLLIWFFK